MARINVITPNTNISAGSISENFIKDGAVTTIKIADGAITSAKIGVDVIVAEDIANNAITVAELQDNAVTTAKILDDNVTLAKISTSGASDGQSLAYNSTSGAVEWTTGVNTYTDAEAITAVQGEATLDLTGKTSISNSAGLTSPILHLVTDNSGWDKAQLMLTDANDDAVSIIGRNNTTYSNYQYNFTLDPNHTKPRTNVPGTGFTYAGDYFVNFRKNYGDQDNIDMQMEVYGANDGFSIVARDDWNGGVDSYNYKPITLRGSDIAMKIGTTPYGATVEKLAFNDFGTSISNGALVHGLDRTGSNHQMEYTGTDTTGTPGVPSMKWRMHRRDSQDRLMEIMEATDYGSGDAAVVEIGKQLTVNPVKVASAVPIELANLSSAPGSPTAGMMYFNTSDSKFYGYNGSAWILLDTQ